VKFSTRFPTLTINTPGYGRLTANGDVFESLIAGS